MNLIAHLDALDALLSDEGRWTQGWYARDANGCYVSPSHPDAVCWCLDGGIERVVDSDAVQNALWFALTETLGRSYISWQDEPERTFAEVKQLLADTRTRLAAEGRER